MSKSLKIYSIVFVVMILIVVLIDSTRRKPIDWTPSYKLEDKIPLGLFVLNNEMDGLTGRKVQRYNLTPYEYFQGKENAKHVNETFLIINDDAYLDEESANVLISSVSKGSTLLISATTFPNNLLDTLDVTNGYQFLKPDLLKHDSVNLTLTNPVWKNETYPLSPTVCEFQFVDVDSKKTTALGYVLYPDSKKYIGFIRIKFGKGYVFLHNQPTVFTNFSLLKDNNLSEYAAHVLSYVPKNNPVVWLVKNQTNNSALKGYNDAQTPLGVIFRYPSLRMAWLLSLYGLLLFIFFRAKRKQRVVPVIKPLRNTTVEFTQTIGNLYLQEDDAVNIMEKKILYFMDRVRTKYYLDTHKTDDSFIRRLQVKSGKDPELIRQIVDSIRRFEKTKTAGQKDLIQMNDWMERFWEN